MGFSVKLAPGVRVRASSRGVRTSLGPRLARVHVGGGRTGVSTGVGPVGYYTTVGGPRPRSTSTGSANRQIATAARQQALADKAAEGERLRRAFDSILALHREGFANARRPQAPPPPEPPVDQLRRIYRDQARKATSVFDRTGRRQALTVANQRADSDIASARRHLADQRAAQQAQLDEDWAALTSCEPDAVLRTLSAAFADNQAAASAVGVDDTEVSLVVVVPPVSDIPDRKPALTPTGKPSLKKLTKTETADFYKHLVCGHLLVTLREAFAVAPGLQSARIVAVRAATPDAYGRTQTEVIAAGRCSRFALAGVHWERVDAVQVFNDCCTEQILIQKGATRSLQPVPLAAEPELRALVEAVDLSEHADDD